MSAGPIAAERAATVAAEIPKLIATTCVKLGLGQVPPGFGIGRVTAVLYAGTLARVESLNPACRPLVVQRWSRTLTVVEEPR